MAKNITKIKHRFPLRQLRLGVKTISQHWPIVSLLFLTSVIGYLNFSPQTWLIGWDNLLPELNFGLDLKRNLFSVWQEYRGLGLLAGMAHSADLPRELILLLLYSLGTPANLLRYLWTFSMLALGSIGAYTAILYLLHPKFDPSTRKIAAFLGSLFYLFNLSTVQTFFVPFETFTSFYGFFPWLIFLLLQSLNSPRLKNYFLLFIVSLLASSSFYVETLFITFILFTLPFFFHHVTSGHFSFRSFLQVKFSLLSFALSQFYWLLPIVFFVFTNGQVGTAARINLLSSPETFSRNLNFANPQSIALLKGYLFEFVDLNQGGKYDFLLQVWRDHLHNPIITTLGCLIFALIITGVIYAFRKKLTFNHYFLWSAAICLFFLFGGTIIVNNYPLVSELLRSPYTKFSIPLSFVYAIYFSVGTIFLLDLFSFLHSRLTYLLTSFTITITLLAFTSPIFSGLLISPSLRLQLPPQYLQLFSFFNNQPSGRIANFPILSHWGWQYYNWGYRGSGFIWYGLPQALTDRAFDVWEKTNENYYEQLSQALYSENWSAFDQTISQYDVNWLIIDHSIISPDDRQDLYIDKLVTHLQDNSDYHLVNSFDLLDVYQYTPAPTNFVSTFPPRTSSPVFSINPRPQILPITEQGIKLSTRTSQNGTITIPSLTDSEHLLPVSIAYRKNQNQVIFKIEPIVPSIFINSQEISPSSSPQFLTLDTNSNNNLILEINRQPYEFQLPGELNNQSIYYPLTTVYLPTHQSIPVRLFNGIPDYEHDFTTPLQQSDPYQCYTTKFNRHLEKIVTENTLSIFGADVVGCISVHLSPYFNDTYGQLLSVKYRYASPTFTPANISLSTVSLDPTSLPQPLEPKNTLTATRQFAIGSHEPLLLNLILEANDIKNIQEIDYQSVTVGSHFQLDATNFNLLPINEYVSSVDTNTPISITVPTTESIYTVSQTPLSNSLTPLAQSCDSFRSGSTDKQVTDQGIMYSSRNTINCDYLNLRHLPHSTAYTFTFDLQHLSGLTPTICLENFSTRRCDISERLIISDHPQTLIQTITNPHEPPGYTLHLYNQSFSPLLSRNNLKSLTITPFPLNFISQIKLNSQGSSTNQGTIASTLHPAEFLYLIHLDQPLPTILSLYQTYSSHWRSVVVDKNFFQLSTLNQIVSLIPQLLHHQSSPSTKLDWHNSWNINSPYIALVYWPQYLEFIGLALIPLTLFVFLLLHLVKRKH